MITKLLVTRNTINQWNYAGYFGRTVLDQCLEHYLKRPKQQEIFTSIQNFDTKEVIMSCPVYADFDGDGALEDCRSYVKRFIELFKEEPMISFSGNRGFHVVSRETIVEHGRCHLVTRELIKRMGSWPTLDMKVYTKKRLWRENYSFNFKGGLYKIPLSHGELNILDYSDIRVAAQTNERREMIYEENGMGDWFFDNVEDIISNMKVLKEQPLTLPAMTDTNLITTPCILTMFNELPADGDCNATIFILSKYLKALGLSVEDAVNRFMNFPHYALREEKEHDVAKVVRSVYASPNEAIVNCEYDDVYADIMLKSCDKDICYKKIDVKWRLR